MAKAPKVSRAELARAKTDTRLAIIGAVTNLIERIAVEKGINQSRLAERLGVSRSNISQLLSAPLDKNWTIDTIGELLAALEARISRIDMRRLDEMSPTNDIHPWLEKALNKAVIETIATLPSGTQKKLSASALVPARALPTDTEKPLTPRLVVKSSEYTTATGS